MKLRYYLRGLGIGIIVTAIIMSFTRQPEKLTDAQIKMRALELGMVEETVLADLQEEEMTSNEGEHESKIPAFEDIVEVENEEMENESKIEEGSETEAESETGESSDIKEESETVENSETEAEAESETGESSDANSVAEETESVDANIESDNLSDGIDMNSSSTEIPVDEVVENYIVISVVGGNDSFTISEKLYEAGLINSATEFNQYLVKNGYDRRLRPGNHEIPADATEEQMAKILCNME